MAEEIGDQTKDNEAIIMNPEEHDVIGKLLKAVDALTTKVEVLTKHDADCIAERATHQQRIGDIQKLQGETAAGLALVTLKQEKTDAMYTDLSEKVTKISTNFDRVMVYFEGFLVFIQAGGMTKKAVLWLSTVLGGVMLIFGFLFAAIKAIIFMAANYTL